MANHSLINAYTKASKIPGGKKAFSVVVAQKAPFFTSISPVITELGTELTEVTIRNQRKVRNHIGTVHAIAMCNMAELAGGLLSEVSMPKSMRWIPKGMNVEYIAKAETATMRAQAKPTIAVEEGVKQDWPVVVEILDDNNQLACRATINMFLTPKPKK